MAGIDQYEGWSLSGDQIVFDTPPPQPQQQNTRNVFVTHLNPRQTLIQPASASVGTNELQDGSVTPAKLDSQIEQTFLIGDSGEIDDLPSVGFPDLITNDYERYIMRGRALVPATNLASPAIRFGVSGSSWITTSTYYRWTRYGANLDALQGLGEISDTADDRMYLVQTGGGVGTAAGEGLAFDLEIIHARSASQFTWIRGSLVYSASGGAVDLKFSGRTNTATLHSSVQLLFTSNIASGRIRLYGVTAGEL